MLQPVSSFSFQTIGSAASLQSTATQGTAKFEAILAQAGTETFQKLQSAETLSMQALTGDVGVREVASAVMAAEQALQLSMAVRDKIVTAFLDLSRMQI